VTRRKQSVELALCCILPDSNRPRLDDRNPGFHFQSDGLADLVQATFACETAEQLIKISKKNLCTPESYEFWIRPAAFLHHISNDWCV